MPLSKSLRRRAGRPYVAGEQREAALDLCRRRLESGDRVVICHWSEPDDDPARVLESYLDDLQAAAELAGNGYAYMTCKIDALGDRMADVTAVAACARQVGVRAHWDSLGADTQSIALTCAKLHQSLRAPTGATLPGRWARSLEDAEDLRGLSFPVRLVKGQWASTDSLDPARGMVECARRLAGRSDLVAVATHDAELAREVLAILIESGTPCELEQMLGLPDREPREVAGDLGVPVRVLVPYGAPRPPYALGSAWRPTLTRRLLRDVTASGPRPLSI